MRETETKLAALANERQAVISQIEKTVIALRMKLEDPKVAESEKLEIRERLEDMVANLEQKTRNGTVPPSAATA